LQKYTAGSVSAYDVKVFTLCSGFGYSRGAKGMFAKDFLTGLQD
jgi:hypothetical protein